MSYVLLSAEFSNQNEESSKAGRLEQCASDKTEQLSIRDTVDLQEAGFTFRIQPPGTESFELQVLHLLLSSLFLKILCIFVSLWVTPILRLSSALRCQARCWWRSCTRCWWITRSPAIAHASPSSWEASCSTASPSCAPSRASRTGRWSSWWRVTTPSVLLFLLFQTLKSL